MNDCPRAKRYFRIPGRHVPRCLRHLLKPPGHGGYQTADVVSVDGNTPNLAGIREKFHREHTHSEDEVRVFVEGQGFFWFHKEGRDDEVFALMCEQGDLISVPANTKHWFDLGDPPKLRAIRIFNDQLLGPALYEFRIDHQYRWYHRMSDSPPLHRRHSHFGGFVPRSSPVRNKPSRALSS